MNKIETALSALGWLALLIVLPTWSYVSAAPTFKGVTGGAVVIDHVMLNGFEPTACPAGRIVRADIDYPNIPGAGVRRGVDVTQFANIWGHATDRDAAVPYPGRDGAVPSVSGWGTNGAYVAAAFTAPASATYNTLRFSTYTDANVDALDAAVSTRCGDFVPGAAHCSIRNVGAGDALLKIAQLPYRNGCALVVGRPYYFMFAPSNRLRAAGYISTNNSVGVQP